MHTASASERFAVARGSTRSEHEVDSMLYNLVLDKHGQHPRTLPAD